MAAPYGITWNLTEVHGWGLVGIHTALYLIEQGRAPFLMAEPKLSTVRPHLRETLEVLNASYQRYAQLESQRNGRVLQFSDIDVLQSLGNRMVSNSPWLVGRRTIGVIAFENTLLDAEAKANGDKYDFIVTHSTYNRDLLQAAGFRDVRMAWQGADPTEMVLPRRGKRFKGRFVVFSGGKLEFRKGQDVVLRAFARFQARHRDALLVTAWHSPWPDLAKNISESPLCAETPQIDPATGRLEMGRWAAAHGVTKAGFVDLGFLARPALPQLMADIDVGLFPNRCEGATNLVAMEAMGAGVPCIISANTGHVDLMVEPDTCFPLTRQTPLANPNGDRNGWCESDVDEIVDHLETVYANRAEAKRRAKIGRNFIAKKRTWRQFAETFVAECDR
jgi:glycosyltransferase involved in cell wall biosynthesis